MTISQIISGSTQALNQWLDNQTPTQNVTTSSNNTSNIDTNDVSNAPTLDAYPTVSTPPVSQAPVYQAPVSQAPVYQAPASKAPASKAPASKAPVSNGPVFGPTASEGFKSMYVYDTQSMNTFGDVDINKKKRNSTTSSGDYTTDSHKVISKSDEVQPNTYNQMELEKKVKYWDKNQEKLLVENSTNLKSWSQYA
jgi:hypothetical protein